MKVLCTICARGGSKGIKNKNIKELNGRPLIAYTIETAKKCNVITDIVVSTDSPLIKEVAEKYGAFVPFLRPDELATDSCGKVDVIRHACREMEARNNKQYDIIIDLDVTSPLRTVEDITNAFDLLSRKDLDIVYSVCEAKKNPYFNMVEINQEGYPVLSKKLESSVFSRQAAPKVYELNASIYVYKREYLLKASTVFSDRSGVYIMPQERSVDIDNAIDFAFVEFIIKKECVLV